MLDKESPIEMTFERIILLALLPKEIGIRKVLGASITNIITLISKDFLVLLVVSNVIAWPVAYYLYE